MSYPSGADPQYGPRAAGGYPQDYPRPESPPGYAPQGGDYPYREEALGATQSVDDEGKGGKRRLKDKKSRRRKVRKVLLISIAVVVVLGAGGAFAGWEYLRSVENKVTKVDAFAEVPEAERPPPEPTKAMNILILGSDSRDPDTSGSRSDTIMVAHVTADHKTSQIVSIPRDSWVPIPRTPDGKRGGVTGKINWSYSWGGIPLMIRSVEALTKVRIDHVVVIDFAGFKQVVDAVGGIDVNNDVRFTNFFHSSYTFEKGRIHLDGDLALQYARNRKTLPDGDFGRIRHQQMVVKAVLDKATSAGTIADPVKLNRFLNAIAKTITTDKGFDMISTATELRGIGSKDIRFITAPTKGTGMVGDQSVVFVDPAGCASLFSALKSDQAATWTKP